MHKYLVSMIICCACSSEHTPGPAQTDANLDSSIPVCEVTAHQRYAPSQSAELESFPDDLMAISDESSPTGLRLAPSAATAAWLEDLPDVIRGAAVQLAGLTGFGSNSDISLRFDAPLDLETNAAFQLQHGPVSLYAFAGSEVRAIPFRLFVGEDGHAIRAQPARPLALGTRHLLLVDNTLRAQDGGCVGPSPSLTALLNGQAPTDSSQHVVDAYSLWLERLNLDVTSISAATSFTIHSDLAPLGAMANAISLEGFAWTQAPECEEGLQYTQCEAVFEGRDVRGVLGHDVPRLDGPWLHPVSFWLPNELAEPAPVIVFAHGLNADRATGRRYARRLVQHGFVVVAMDAAQHGAHPLAAPDSALPALDFLGLSIVNLEIDARSLRANIDQTAMERLMLLRLLHLEPDLDGDGEPELDLSHIGYYGESLGGMLGSQLVALSNQIDAAVFGIAGGRLLDFATGTGQVEAFKPVLIDLFGSEARFDRLLPVAQTIVDAADPATWAPHVFTNRIIPRETPPHILFPVALKDDTVPPATGKALARALAIPHIGPIIEDVPSLEQQDAPVHANHLTGESTAGFFQFDRVSASDGVIEATHANLPLSDESLRQTTTFFDTWLSDGVPTIIDPYAELETPPLAP